MYLVYRDDLERVMYKLQNELERQFLYKPMTEATKHRMLSFIESYMRNMGAGERNAVWQVRFEIVPNGISSFDLTPVLDNVTLVDRKSPLDPK